MRKKLIIGLTLVFLVVFVGGAVVSVLMSRLKTVTMARHEVEVFHLTMDGLSLDALYTVDSIRRSWDDPEKFRGSLEKVHAFKASIGSVQKEFLNAQFGEKKCGMCHDRPDLLVERIETILGRLERSFSDLTLMASLYMTRKEGVSAGPVVDEMNDALDMVQLQLQELTTMVAPMIEHIDLETGRYILRIERIHNVTIILTVLLVLLVVLSLLAAVYWPVRQLTKGTEAIVKGDYDYRIALEGKDEMALLAERFNFMAEAVANREISIMDKKQQLEDLNEALEIKVRERTRDLRTSKAELDRKLKELEATNEEHQASYTQLQATAAELQETQNKLKENYDILKEMNTELQQANEVKNKFLSIMSHELRTPLTVINGYLSLILEKNFGEPSPELKEIMRVIKDQAKNQLTLIEDLLDLTRIESGEFRLYRQPCDAAELVRKIAESYLPTVDEEEIHIDLDLEQDLPEVHWDQQKIVQVFQNLIDNAIKFTPAGGHISISARSKSDFIELRVSDNGVGIPEDRIDRIFDRFFQVDSTSTRQYGGSGLGLSIVREIVQAHRGRIFVESEVGEGTTFMLLMPTGEPERYRVEDGERDASLSRDSLGEWPRGNGETILVVDDDPAFLRMMETILPREGYRVKVCETATEVPDRVKQYGAHIVLLDLMMPEIDGFEVCRRLKEDPETRSLPILVVSASGGKEVSRRVHEAGADDHLTKPFDQFDILFRIHSLLEESRGEVVVEEPGEHEGEELRDSKRTN